MIFVNTLLWYSKICLHFQKHFQQFSGVCKIKFSTATRYLDSFFFLILSCLYTTLDFYFFATIVIIDPNNEVIMFNMLWLKRVGLLCKDTGTEKRLCLTSCNQNVYYKSQIYFDVWQLSTYHIQNWKSCFK